jgi:hypothetical protein
MEDRQHKFDFVVRGGLGALAKEWEKQITFIKPNRDGRIAVIVLSDRYFGCFVHFVDGRSVACLADNCMYCKRGHKARWRYFFEVETVLTKRRGIVELGKRAGRVLEEAMNKYGTIRGITGVLERKGKGDNAQLVLTVLDKAEADGLPKESSWLGLLIGIWRAQHERSDEDSNE